MQSRELPIKQDDLVIFVRAAGTVSTVELGIVRAAHHGPSKDPNAGVQEASEPRYIISSVRAPDVEYSIFDDDEIKAVWIADVKTGDELVDKLAEA